MPRGLCAGFDTYRTTLGRGPVPALMIHCALGQSALWQHVAAPLDARLSAVAFDMPGHGQSADWPGGTDYLADVARIAAMLCDTPRLVIGHSFGGVAALALAVARPERVRALVLIEPVFFAVTRGSAVHARHNAAFAPFVAAMQAGDHMHAARHFHGLWGGGIPFDTMPEAQQRAMAKRMPLIVAGAPGIEDDSQGLLAPGRLETLDLPVLLIRGGDSPDVIAAIHARLAERLPNAQDAVIACAGHMVPLTHPEPVAQQIAAHLDAIGMAKSVSRTT